MAVNKIQRADPPYVQIDTPPRSPPAAAPSTAVRQTAVRQTAIDTKQPVRSLLGLVLHWIVPDQLDLTTYLPYEAGQRRWSIRWKPDRAGRHPGEDGGIWGGLTPAERDAATRTPTSLTEWSRARVPVLLLALSTRTPQQSAGSRLLMREPPWPSR